jgi:hypothetical protein
MESLQVRAIKQIILGLKPFEFQRIYDFVTDIDNKMREAQVKMYKILRLKALIWLFCKDLSLDIEITYYSGALVKFRIKEQKFEYGHAGHLHVYNEDAAGDTVGVKRALYIFKKGISSHDFESEEEAKEWVRNGSREWLVCNSLNHLV